MEYIFMNGDNSVAIVRNGYNVTQVFIDGVLHVFEENDTQDKNEYAIQIKRNKYKKFFNHQFENLLVLSGAGSSKNSNGKLLAELWDDSVALLSENTMNKLCELVHYTDKDENGEYIKNLERLLSLSHSAKEYVEDEDINIAEIVEKLQKLICEECNLKLPEQSAQEIFLEKIVKRKVTLPRAKIFNLNYDTLFEQAGHKKNFTIIDGFSLSFPRVFSGRNFDYDIVLRDKSRVKEEDNFIKRVFHHYKLHGSVDWERQTDGSVKQLERTENALMIYPKDSKYENSFEQPFFEMMSRFHQNLRKENVLLICIGFSFNDKHIVTAISEALSQNPSFQIAVVNKGIDTNPKFKWLCDLAKIHNNIVLMDELFSDFAINYPDLKSYNQEEQNTILIQKAHE